MNRALPKLAEEKFQHVLQKQELRMGHSNIDRVVVQIDIIGRVCPEFLVRRCLNQDLRDLEICGIAGERVMAGKGILFRHLKVRIA